MPPRTQIEIAGADAKRFLHNFCTADILKLEPNAGAELFITNVKGKILSHGFVFASDEFLVYETVAGEAEAILGHLDRYTLADDVELKDVSDGWSFVYAGGPEAEWLLRKATGEATPQGYLSFKDATLNKLPFAYSRGGAISENGFTICCRDDRLEDLGAALQSAGFAEAPQDVLEVLRVEAGMPQYGADITDDNLPQEVNRNQQAISFTKGCYLGQETVARLDALGHVNKLLVGVRFAGSDVPGVGTALTAGETTVGNVTSAVYSPRLNAPLGLAYVRTKQIEARTPLNSNYGAAEVVALPVGG